MRAVRYWSTSQARTMERIYNGVEWLMIKLDPMWRAIGYERLDRPVAAVEKAVKGLLFDCQMCGQCVLSSTGMSCPMNCPKTLRNGPCGGVRSNGNCEVKPDMRCVWVEAARGSRKMREGEQKIQVVQLPVDRSREGKSSWLREARKKIAQQSSGGSDGNS
ncbi:methylenetetrahydrofolate reductase C-terminal domain-containing protein [Porticoccus sp. W117]|uniref:methylenetetrahydrofolate reductase C-terminal domain-containing protein n=1 Tax=Porticoccus sp. W117 TaxID=3054777 RepID=UPI00259A44F9|nr:methylenetetrahydrofolate reductase C-terminal domain-containing protein [Porticoccus sp. W117]MDM3871394.1 methylenetetrahydrofolate reductase C-terminal domain-containing protein [Porticoccus sp. W117]